MICIFLRPILNDLQTLNKSFQSSKSDPTKLLNDLEYVIYTLKKFVIVDEQVDILKDDFEKFIFYNCYLRYNFENRINSALAENLLDCDEASLTRKTCVSFVENLMKELISRYLQNILICSVLFVFLFLYIFTDCQTTLKS